MGVGQTDHSPQSSEDVIIDMDGVAPRHRGPMSRTHRRPTPIAAVERAERSSKSRNETRTECVHLTTASRSEAVSTLHRGRLNFTFLLRLVDQRLQK